MLLKSSLLKGGKAEDGADLDQVRREICWLVDVEQFSRWLGAICIHVALALHGIDVNVGRCAVELDAGNREVAELDESVELSRNWLVFLLIEWDFDGVGNVC